jgi:hypothetical protein
VFGRHRDESRISARGSVVSCPIHRALTLLPTSRKTTSDPSRANQGDASTHGHRASATRSGYSPGFSCGRSEATHREWRLVSSRETSKHQLVVWRGERGRERSSSRVRACTPGETLRKKRKRGERERSVDGTLVDRAGGESGVSKKPDRRHRAGARLNRKNRARAPSTRRPARRRDTVSKQTPRAPRSAYTRTEAVDSAWVYEQTGMRAVRLARQ